MIGLRPILSDSQPNRMKHGVPIASEIAIMICESTAGTFSVWEEEQRVELSAVPHDRFAGGGAKQRQQRDLGVGPLAERFRQRPLRSLAFLHHLLEQRRFI